MSIDMYLSASQSQASSVSGMTKKQIQGYQQLQHAMNDFTLNSPFLTGQAYDSAKSYFAEVLYPLSQGGILLSETVEEAVKRFPEEYLSNVDSGDLKQSELEEKIRQASNLISQAEEIGKQIRASTTPDVTKSFQLSSNAMMIGMYEAIKHDLEKKLRKLVLFNYTSLSIFAEIVVLEAAVNQGLAQTKNAFSSSTGTFSIPSKDNLAWRTTIADKLKEKEQAKMESEKKAFEKDLEGRTYSFVSVAQGAQMWLWVKNPSKITQEDLQFNERYKNFFNGDAGKYGLKNVLIPDKQDDWLTTISTELSTGINAVTGKHLTTIEKIQRWSALTSILATSLVGAYWATKLGQPTKAPATRIPKIKQPTGKTWTGKIKKGEIPEGPPPKLTPPKKVSDGNDIPKRPSWRQSEIEAELEYNGYDSQKSFLNGEEVPYGTKGSTRPELFKSGHSIEVKNYNVQTNSGQNNLINNVSKQIKSRSVNLPEGTNQTIIIDVRGQIVTNEILKKIRDRILAKSGVNVEIIFKR